MENINNKKTIYSFLGLPASGKGTQSELFAQRKGLPLISIGDLVREEMESYQGDPAVLQDIKERYESGVPQKDEVVIGLIKKKLKTIEGGAVFDNFPFSTHQAELLNDLITEEHWNKPTLIYIKINPETSYERILNRKICPTCGTIYNGKEVSCLNCKTALVKRTDDNKETLETRIEFYTPRIDEMINFFSINGKIITIDGEPEIKEVTKQMEAIE